ncbi:MAG: hypothetical protein AAFQ68_13795, partial [Bacteroidota bacterium]
MRRKTLAPFWLLAMLFLGNVLFAQQALFVTDSDPANYNSSDQNIYARLQSLGLTITPVGGPSNPATAAAANGKDVVIISSTASTAAIGGMYTNTPVPMVVCESYLFDNMHMTGNVFNVDYGQMSPVDRVRIIDPSHPIASGFNGNVTVTAAPTTLRWGKPSNSADRVARLLGAPNRFAIFVYETGDMMVGMPAPAMRIGFFFETVTGGHTTNAGWTMFDQSVMYALGSAANCTAQTEVLKTPNANVVLGAGGTQTITANVFTPGVVPNGYSTLYLLTTGGGQIIQQTANSPSFTVSAPGTYSFHSLVYNQDYLGPDHIRG